MIYSRLLSADLYYLKKSFIAWMVQYKDNAFCCRETMYTSHSMIASVALREIGTDGKMSGSVDTKPSAGYFTNLPIFFIIARAAYYVLSSTTTE